VAGVTAIVVDANVIIAAIEPGHVHHSRAADILAAASGGIFVHPLTMAEILVSGLRQGNAEELQQALADAGIRAAPGDAVSPGEMAAARHRSGVRMPDAVVLATALALALPLATFDRLLVREALAAGVSIVS
jgi:predicted nucleic acid-binding protein